MKNNALILLWKGNAIPDYLVQKIAEVLTTNSICIPEMLTVCYKDENAISNALLNTSNPTIDFCKTEIETDEAVMNAVIYIGKRFEASLPRNNGSLTQFAIELAEAVAKAKQRISFNGTDSSDEILTAVEIIATKNAVIPAFLAKKYKFTTHVVDVIKKIYEKL